MSQQPYVPHRRISLQRDPTLTEKWLQQRIIEDPTVLGLGELDVKDVERTQPRASRLDLLLYDAESHTRYEVELQLGPTDESHLIRTIEYWDIERRRFPQYEHVGVIVAEEITARFFNVISLFNGFIPLVAIQVNAIAVQDAVTLVFTTVLDRMPLGIEEDDDVKEPRDRRYWEDKGSAPILDLTDQLLSIVRELEPSAAPKYNKHYIGITRNGVPSNFVTFKPRRQYLLVELKIPRSAELTQQIEDAGIDLLTYHSRWGQYRLSVTKPDVAANEELLRQLIKLAHEHYRP